MLDNKQELVELVEAALGVDELTENTEFDTLNIDDVDKVELCMKIEEEFDLEIPDTDYERWTSVFSIIEYLNGRGITIN